MSKLGVEVAEVVSEFFEVYAVPEDVLAGSYVAPDGHEYSSL